jgi:hypothetical protein
MAQQTTSMQIVQMSGVASASKTAFVNPLAGNASHATIYNYDVAGTSATALGTALVGGGTGVIAVTPSVGGSGYVVAPNVVVSGGDGTATATSTIVAGSVTAISVTVSIAYTTLPTLTIDACPTTSAITVSTDSTGSPSFSIAVGSSFAFSLSGFGDSDFGPWKAGATMFNISGAVTVQPIVVVTS